MQVPRFVRRAALRLLVWGAALAAAIALGGWLGERLWLGADTASAERRLTAEVQQRISRLAADLGRAVASVRQDAALVSALKAHDVSSLVDLFDRIAAADASAARPGLALAVYTAEGRALAWSGRPGQMSLDDLTGDDTLFLAPGATGLRLVRVTPIHDRTAGDRRVGTMVAEAPLVPENSISREEGFVMHVGDIPVRLQVTAEKGSPVPPHAIVDESTNTPLATLAIDPRDVARARARWRSRVLALEIALAGALLLLLIGPVADWRRVAPGPAVYAVLTAAMLVVLLLVRAFGWWAARLTVPEAPPLVASEAAGGLSVALASPVDFLLTALLAGALIALGWSVVDQWRRCTRVRVVPGAAPASLLFFLGAQLAAGAVAGAIVVTYQHALRDRLALLPFDVLHFSLHPFEPARIAVQMGLVVLHAALLALAVLALRAARVPWVVAADRPGLRAAAPVLWVASGVGVVLAVVHGWSAPPRVPSLVVVLVAVAVAWRARQIRARFAHASQASRLTALFLALAAPSVVFYPSLVEASGRARRQVIESRYAPEVMDQRKNLQRVLKTAMAHIDALPDLAELVRMGEPVVSRPAPYEAAFRVWERTVLERDRVTSSVELYDAAGSLVSRFALKLPHAGGPQIYQESSCEWETFEEVSPFFAEERRLLHAGRGVCIETPSGRTVVGSIAVHVMLDYSNLSFISARSPYTALLRGQDDDQREVGPRERVEFNVYGWSRSPLYVSGRTAWPIDSVFDRIFAARDPFWARVVSGGTEYEVYFLNDRFGIYALGYPLTGTFGHLISIAELVVLGAATFLLLTLGGFAYGLLAARTPASGRALLREVRASFYRKLFLAFVAVAVGPVLALALLTRAYIAALMQEDLEMEAARTAASASRVVEDVRMFQMAGMTGRGVVDDDLLVWLSRVIAQDVNIFDRTTLIASSERSLFAYGLLPRSTPGDIYRSIILDGRPSYVTRESVGATEYLVAAAPVRVQDREAILTVPLTLRQQEIEWEIDELDRRVLLGAVLFIVVGALIGYSLAERIADPVNRLMRATDRIARGDLRARVVATSSDELRRLVEAFNDMAARLEQQRIELERTNRLKAWAEAARQVAHDVKNPLTPIQLNAEHLRRVHQDHGEPLGPVLDECVNNILQQVRLLRRIANEFSSFASTPSVRPAPESLRELVSEVLRPYRTALHERVAIEEDVPAALPPVLVDKAVLARALSNVVENALHAMPDEGTLRVSARALDEDQVELAVADTGVGMSEADLARIFEPYFSTRAAGTGLGLTIARRNVEANGGSIAVESEVGRGTTVRITLPTARGAA